MLSRISTQGKKLENSSHKKKKKSFEISFTAEIYMKEDGNLKQF
jgi:hypothetical protein